MKQKQYVETLNYSLKRKSKLIDEEVQYYNNIPLFNWIEISPIDACNRKCVFCPKSDPKIAPDTYFKMETSLIEKLANELVEVGFKGTVAFAGYGEPLLAKNIYDMVKILSPVCNVEIVTNGDPLKPKIIDKCFDAGVNKLVVSMYDGPHQVKHFEELFSKSKMPKDKYVLRDRWYKEDEGYGLMLTNRAGVLDYGNKNTADNPSNMCFYAHYSMMIDWNGNIYLCTQDWKRKDISGNLNEKKMIDIWNSDWLKMVRINLSKGKRAFSPCKGCNANGTMHGVNHAKAWDKYYGI